MHYIQNFLMIREFDLSLWSSVARKTQPTQRNAECVLWLKCLLIFSLGDQFCGLMNLICTAMYKGGTGGNLSRQKPLFVKGASSNVFKAQFIILQTFYSPQKSKIVQ